MRAPWESLSMQGHGMDAWSGLPHENSLQMGTDFAWKVARRERLVSAWNLWTRADLIPLPPSMDSAGLGFFHTSLGLPGSQLTHLYSGVNPLSSDQLLGWSVL